MSPPRPSAESRASLSRALSALDASAEADQVSVIEMAARLGIHRSNAVRLLRTLEKHGLVQRSEAHRYRLGAGVNRLAEATTARMGVVRHGHLVARRLAARTGGTVETSIVVGDDAVCVDHVHPRGTPSSAVVGHRRPLATSSPGRVLLAAPDAGVLTTVSPDRVEVTARFVGISGTVLAALGVVAPPYRVGAAQLPGVETLVRAAAADIGSALGAAEGRSAEPRGATAPARDRRAPLPRV